MQANNLIVTGSSRFLNEIKGKIDWTNILNKPSTFTPTIGTSATTAMAGNTNVNNVTQTATTVTSDTKYELLFSDTADNTNRTEGTRKSSLLTFSPKPAGVKLTMNYDGSRPNNYGDITIKGNNDSDSYITLHSSSAGMSYMWIKHPTPGVGIFLEGGSDSSSEYSKGMISADDFVVSGHDWEGNNITWDGTNTSLKTALANKISKETNTTVSWTSSATGRTVTCMLAKIGTIVICSISGSTDANHSITAWTQTQLGAGQIPAGYRPSSATEGRISIQTGGAVVTVNTVGTVAMQTWSNLGGQMAFGGTFWWKTS